MKKFIDFIFGIHRQIAHIQRFNTTPFTKKETVAEHSYFVTHYARLLADYLEQKGYKIDKLKVVDMALIHDNEECWSGDMVYMVKKESKQISDVMNKIAESAIKIVLSSLDKKIQDYWYSCWKEWQNAKSIEKQIVVVADMLSIITLVTEQLYMGNKYCKKILQRVIVRWLKTSEYYDSKWMLELLSILNKKIYRQFFKKEELDILNKGELKEDEYRNELWGQG